MTLRSFFKLMVYGHPGDPPKGAVTSAISQAVQEHEVAVARFNQVACDILHPPGCHCYELPEHAAQV